MMQKSISMINHAVLLTVLLFANAAFSQKAKGVSEKINVNPPGNRASTLPFGGS